MSQEEQCLAQKYFKETWDNNVVKENGKMS